MPKKWAAIFKHFERIIVLDTRWCAHNIAVFVFKFIVNGVEPNRLKFHKINKNINVTQKFGSCCIHYRMIEVGNFTL